MLFKKAKQRYVIIVSLFASTLLLAVTFFSISESHQDHDVLNSSIRSSNLPLNLPASSSSSSSSPPPPVKTDPDSRPKVFVIGLSKTGTTSLGDALSRLSFLRIGWRDIRSRFLFRSYLKHDLSPLISVTHVYDAFEDLPWALVYQDMARLYPDARFILTLRKSEQAWLRSISDHTARRKWMGHEVVYGGIQARGHESAYLAVYRNHTDSVRAFFAGKGYEERLLEFVIDAEEEEGEGAEKWGKWSALLSFLGMEDSEDVRRELGEFPRSNGKDSLWNRDPLKVWWLWDKVLYFGEDALLGTFEWLGWLNVSDALTRV